MKRLFRTRARARARMRPTVDGRNPSERNHMHCFAYDTRETGYALTSRAEFSRRIIKRSLRNAVPRIRSHNRNSTRRCKQCLSSNGVFAFAGHERPLLLLCMREPAESRKLGYNRLQCNQESSSSYGRTDGSQQLARASYFLMNAERFTSAN